MPESTLLRDFIPSGECVNPDSTAVDAFNRLDEGVGAEQDLALAKAACRSCIQLSSCSEQLQEIGDELWYRGAHSPVIGGSLAESRNNIIGGLHETSLRFELSRMPQDGARKLGLIRQALRSGQLSAVARTPNNIGTFTEKYRGILQQQDPNIAGLIEADLTEEQREKALRRIVTLLCQQADFDTKKRSTTKGADNQRYNPELFDFEGNYPTIKSYLNDLIEIKQLGVRRPEAVNLFHSPELCRKILEQFKGVAPMSILRQLVGNNPRAPLEALIAYSGRLQAGREADQGLTESQLRIWALSPDSTISIEELGAHVNRLSAQHSTLGVQVVRRAINSASPEQTIATTEQWIAEAQRVWGDDHPVVNKAIIKHFASRSTSQLEDLNRYEATYLRLSEQYGKHPDFSNGTIRRFAKDENPEAAILPYQERLALWRSWKEEPSSPLIKVPDSFLREHALTKDAINAEEVAKAHTVKYLMTRYNRRKRERAANNQPVTHIERWMVVRIAELYPLEAMDDVAESLYDLMSAGILTDHLSELEMLHLPGPYAELERICDPKTRHHLTFAGALRDMSPTDRLALACDFDIARLLYGEDLDGEKLAGHLGVETVFGYGINDILPKFKDHLHTLPQDSPKTQPPLSRFDLVWDLEYLHARGLIHSTEKGLARQPTIVGSSEVSFAMPSTVEQVKTALPQPMREWIAKRGQELYAPSEQPLFYSAFTAALENGLIRLEAIPSSMEDSMPDFAVKFCDALYSGDNIKERDRAAVACAIKADRLIYRYDLSSLLKSRLHGIDIHEYVATIVLPKTASWIDIDTVIADERCTPAGLNALLTFHKVGPEKLWTANGRTYCIASDIPFLFASRRAAITAPPTTWISQSVLAERIGTVKILERITLDRKERYIFRDTNSGILDVYYAPWLVAQLAQL